LKTPILDELGAKLWGEQARDELGRLGGRAPSPGGLTPTERRIAALVAEGKSNKQSRHHSSSPCTPSRPRSPRSSRKLDVHSRIEMARKLADATADPTSAARP
jgi:hypothetical protein